MHHSYLTQASLFMASAILATTFHALPGAAQSEPLIQHSRQIEVIQPSRTHQQVQPPFQMPIGSTILDGNGCPEGTHLIMWDKPIYDDDGLFVVGYEPTPYCVEDDLEPEG